MPGFFWRDVVQYNTTLEWLQVTVVVFPIQVNGQDRAQSQESFVCVPLSLPYTPACLHASFASLMYTQKHIRSACLF